MRLPTAILLVLFAAKGTSCFPSDGRKPFCSKAKWDRIWESTGTVPEKLATVPDSPLYMGFRTSSGFVKVYPNDTLTTDQVSNPPYFKFFGEPGALYTFLIEDQDIAAGFKFWHWLVVNSPGGDHQSGEERMNLLPPFFFEFNPATGQLDTETTASHRFLVLAYKQPGRIQVDEGQTNCDETLIKARIGDRGTFVQKYNLQGPVAGNFFRVQYNGQSSNDEICYFTKCTGQPFPALLTGVNDEAQCQK